MFSYRYISLVELLRKRYCLIFLPFCSLVGFKFHLSIIVIIIFSIASLHLPHGESGMCLFPARCLLLNLGQEHKHTHTLTHTPSPGSIGGTQSSWHPLTPDTSPKHPTTPPHTQYTLRPGEGPITPTGGNTLSPPLVWSDISKDYRYLAPIMFALLPAHHLLCSPVCTTIPPTGLLPFHFSLVALCCR